MRKIKVLMVAGAMNVGGIESQLMHLLRNADREKFQIDFTSTMPDAIHRKEIEALGSRFILIPRMSWRKPWVYFKAMFKVMKEGNYDIVHSHELFHTGITLFLAKLAGVPCRFAHAHNWCDDDGTGRKTSKVRLIYNALMRKLISTCSTVQVGCSSWAGEFVFGKKMTHKSSYHLVYNSVDTSKFVDQFYLEESGEFCDPEWKNVINVGRFTHVKNQLFLTDIAECWKKQGKKIRFLCAGNGDDEYFNAVKKAIEEKQLQDYVKLLGVRTDIDKLMRKSDALVLPSKYEGMPLVMIEAQSSGLPCVSADTYSPEVDFEIGKVTWLSLNKGAEVWAKQIEKAIKSGRATKEQVVSAVQAKGFDSKNFTEKLCRLYEADYRKRGNKKTIKVLFLIPGLSEGGAEKVLCNLVNNLDQSRYDITVQNIDVYCPKKYLREGIHYKAINQCKSRLGRKLFSYFFRLCAELKLAYPLFIKGKYDLEIAYLETGATKLLAQSTNRRAGKIAWVHCDLSKKEGMEKSVEKVRKQYGKYDRIVCVSEDSENGFHKLYGNSLKTQVLHNIIDDTEILEKAKAQADPCLDVAVPKLLAIGRLSSEKNFSYLIKSCKKLRDNGYRFQLNILGKGPELEMLQELIYKLELQEHVFLRGFTSNPYPWIANSDLMVCSSIYEGLSTFIQEAFILSKPIVTTPCAGMRELLGESKYGLIVEDSEDGLYDGIRKMLDDSNLKQQYAKASAERRKAFAKETVIKETEELFKNLLKEKRKALRR